MATIPLNGAKACIFDAYGTLFDLINPVAARAARLGSKAGPLSELWRRKQLEYSWLRSLMEEYSDFWTLTGNALDYALDSLDIQNPALRADLMELYLSIPTYEEVPEVLSNLKARGLKTGILSNGSPLMLTSAVNCAGLTQNLDFVLSVDEIKVFKPSPRVYNMAAERLRLAPNEIAFFSSNAWDISGAASFGFQAVWCNRNNMPRERLPGLPMAEISNLRDALTLMEG